MQNSLNEMFNTNTCKYKGETDRYKGNYLKVSTCENSSYTKIWSRKGQIKLTFGWRF